MKKFIVNILFITFSLACFGQHFIPIRGILLQVIDEDSIYMEFSGSILNIKSNKSDIAFNGSSLVNQDELIDASIYFSKVTAYEGDTTGYVPGKPGDIFIDLSSGGIYISNDSIRGSYVLINSE